MIQDPSFFKNLGSWINQNKLKNLSERSRFYSIWYWLFLESPEIYPLTEQVFGRFEKKLTAKFRFADVELVEIFCLLKITQWMKKLLLKTVDGSRKHIIRFWISHQIICIKLVWIFIYQINLKCDRQYVYNYMSRNILFWLTFSSFFFFSRSNIRCIISAFLGIPFFLP